MLKKTLFLLIIGIVSPFILKADWIPVNDRNSSPASPEVTLISDDNNSTVLKIDISGFDLQDITAEGKTYQKIDLLTETCTTDPGCPELPYIARVLAIPDQAGISVEILEKGEVLSFPNINILPARESWFEGSPETSFNEKPAAYSSVDTYPGEFAQADKPSVFRDFRITRVSVFPMQYIPAKKELRVVSSITVRINYGPGKVVNPKTTTKKPIARSFGDLYRPFIFNYQNVLDKIYGGKEEGHELMLCIMPDEFYSSFQPYAEWKRLSGIDIHITKFSDIGANANDATIIKNHIEDAYHNWEVPPTYVLIIGDDGVFPKHIVSYGYSFPNEDYFVEIDGDDYFPEMMIGRFTNQSDYGMQVMINKFLKYEKTPYTENSDWFKKGICCSNNAYISQVVTKRFAAERMLLDGNFTSVDTMMSDSPCSYDVSDVVSAINNGRSWLNYRGEGWSSGWWASCTPMHTPDVTGINNGQKFTFVTSIGCGVAMFDASGGNCFGEEWIEVGTLSSPKGAAAFVGPTSNTHTTYNNKIDKGIYIGMFQEGLETPGQALLRGKLYMYTIFGNAYYVEYHYRVYCVLGDPSMHIWKEVPLATTVNYIPAIPFGNNTVEFTVTHTSTGQPVANALVCVTGNTTFTTGYTDENGNAYVDIFSQVPETLKVTVRGGNIIPYLGTLEVVQPDGPYVVKESYTLDDLAGGNGNGIMETSETIGASLTVKNVGTEEASNIVVIIETTDPYITLTDNTQNYGDIAAGASAVVTNGFGWIVADNIPDLHVAIFEMTATDGTEIWTSYFTVQGHGPVIAFGNLTIDDSQGNQNGRLDPGETANIVIPTYNNGSYVATEAIGSLSCFSSFITLNNTTHDFSGIEAGTMEEAIFNVTVASNAPIGTAISLIYDVVSGGYAHQETYSRAIGLILEDWETGDMNQYEWTTGGSANWAVTTNNPFEGTYCITSGEIDHNESTYFSLQYNLIAADSISFWFEVSSESGYDYLKFYIDNEMMGSWSGAIGWERAAYAVTAGTHTFKWSYSKDGSVVVGSDCAWIDYIILPAAIFQAAFTSSDNNICEGESITFYDQTPGSPIGWEWTFEGGTPGTSTLENPVIEYLTPGVYDVSLTVTNGFDYTTLALEDFINVGLVLDAPPLPTGPSAVCGDEGISAFTTTGITGITSYDWVLEPAEAGYVVGSGMNGVIVWATGFLGEANIKVAGENNCGAGAYTNPVYITRYFPEVNLEPFDWVCVYWPEFELTGGLPEGGIYSGPGVENGWFYPALAGLGTHIITYSYTDANDCENEATETILVDPCTGLDEVKDQAGIRIYPNPTAGMISIGSEQEVYNAEIVVISTLNKVVYSRASETIGRKSLDIDLSFLSKGIYFIKIKSDEKEETVKIIIQ